MTFPRHQLQENPPIGKLGHLQTQNLDTPFYIRRPHLKYAEDALSRLPANHLPADYIGETATEESIYTMTTLSAPAALSIRDIERASANDTELQSVRQFVKTGDAAHLPRPYLPLRYELTTIGQVVLRGTRIVPPASLRSQILQLAHEGHQGIVKTKERLRTKV